MVVGLMTLHNIHILIPRICGYIGMAKNLVQVLCNILWKKFDWTFWPTQYYVTWQKGLCRCDVVKDVVTQNLT